MKQDENMSAFSSCQYQMQLKLFYASGQPCNPLMIDSELPHLKQ